MLRVGYQKASMRKIAIGAGVTVGALYKHFQGKEKIFETICDEVIEQLFAKQKFLLPDDLGKGRMKSCFSCLNRKRPYKCYMNLKTDSRFFK